MIIEWPSNMKPFVVFYCDDDEDDLLMFCDIIKEFDDSITCITDIECESALKQLSEGAVTPDIIFLDINMPRMSGIEMLPRLKAIKRLDDVPIVIYTTSTFAPDIDRCLALGADLVLTKPFDPDTTKEQLSRTFRTYLHHA